MLISLTTLLVGAEPPNLDRYDRKKFHKEVVRYFWDEPYLYKQGRDGLFRRCISEEEAQGVLLHCYGSSYGGHLATFKTVSRVL